MAVATPHRSSSRVPVVLVADDDVIARRLLRRILEDHGLEVEVAEDGQQALDRVGRGGIDLVLLDVVMPRLGGLECCRLLKASQGEQFLPVVLITVRTSADNRVEGLRCGADDYVGKPFDERELLARVGSLLRVKRMHDDLMAAKVRLEELAVHDDLTGLYNYRYLHHRLDDEFKRAERYGIPLSCVMVDVDRFKGINDAYGHDVGDAVLREVAARLRHVLREVDAVARYGGEEFLVILPSTSHENGRIAAERLRVAVAGTPVLVGGVEHRVTVSLGVSAFPGDQVSTKDELLKLADRALYAAKALGRDRACTAADVEAVSGPASESGRASGAALAATG